MLLDSEGTLCALNLNSANVGAAADNRCGCDGARQDVGTMCKVVYEYDADDRT
jgi:hypothetical protein